jgi:hypothetical protein
VTLSAFNDNFFRPELARRPGSAHNPHNTHASCWARNLDGSASIRSRCPTPPSDFCVEWRDRLPLGAHLGEALTLVVHATEDDE